MQIRLRPSLLGFWCLILGFIWYLFLGEVIFDGVLAFANALPTAVSVETLATISIVVFTYLPIFFLDLKRVLVAPPECVFTQGEVVRTTVIRSLGLYATLIVFCSAYWLLPEYGDWYRYFWELLYLLAIPVLVFAPLYLYFTSRLITPDSDTLYHAGLAFLGLVRRRFRSRVSLPVLKEHGRQWLVKSFFLPIMFVFAVNSFVFLHRFDYVGLATNFEFASFFELSYRALLTIDVYFAVVGYLFTLRITNSQIVSTDPSLLGWLVCLICYPPFWNGLVGQVYFNYEEGFYWDQWLVGSPVLLVVWGSAILILTAVYAAATVCLGARFSNLTYRGLADFGVYRWTKHPAYLSKNLSWWLISIPFVSQLGGWHALGSCVLLVGLNYIYYLRAVTEERHLAQYIGYAEYANRVGRSGLLSRVSCWLPGIRFDLSTTLAKSTPVWWQQKG